MVSFLLSEVLEEKLQLSSKYGEVRVWVEVDERRLKVFDVKKSRHTHTSCYIEAPIGKLFRVHYYIQSSCTKAVPVEVKLYIDGRWVDTDISGCNIKCSKVIGYFDGYRDRDTKDSSNFKAFTFAEPELANDQTDGGEMSYIRVVIGWRELQGKVDHRTPSRKKRSRDTVAPRRVAQDSKTAALGVCTAPSQTVIKTDKILECHCKFIKQGCKEDLNFIFHYRKPQYLFEKGIMLAHPDDGDDDEDDEDESNQGSSRKRLRIQPSVDQNALIEQRDKEVEDLTKDDDDDDDDDHFDDNSNDREEIHIDLTLDDNDDDDEDNKIIPPFRFFIRDVR